MELFNQTIVQFTESLASKTSVPGGGGAVAYAGALGIALGDMVGEFTLGKKAYADVEEDMKSFMERAQSLRVRFLECVHQDAVAFEPLSKAYSIPKDDPTREETLERCLRVAAGVPMEVATICCESIDLLEEFAKKGSKLMISDAATGACLCKAALLGAAVNVKVNTRLMKNREYAQKIDERIDGLSAEYGKKADEIYNYVCEKLKFS